MKNVFGAQGDPEHDLDPMDRSTMPEVKIGDSTIMMADAQGQWDPMPAAMYVYVPTSTRSTRRRSRPAACR